MAREDDRLPTLGQLLESTEKSAKAAEEFIESEPQREKQMLEVMKGLESINVKRSPCLYVSMGEGKDRLLMSTIPSVVQLQEDKSYIPLMGVRAATVISYKISIKYPAIDRKGFYEFYGTNGYGIWVNPRDIEVIQDPFATEEIKENEFSFLLKDLSDNRGRVQDVTVDNSEIYPRLKFGPKWTTRNPDYEKYQNICFSVEPAEGIQMLLETQELYRSALEQRTENNKGIIYAAKQMITAIGEKKKRG